MAMSDAEAYEAILGHHEALRAGLAGRVEALRVASGGPGDLAAAKGAALAYLAEEILPHAVAEEVSLYPAAAAIPGLRSLVAGMTIEHRALAAGVEMLAAQDDPAELVATGEAIATMFAEHAAKENDLLLPEVRASGEGRLVALLGAMHEHLARGGPVGPAPSRAHADPELDVRAIAPADRHPTIFATFDGLAPGEGFVLLNDHDPRPLRYQLEAERSGEFTWDYLESGPRTWQVRIGRAPAAGRG
ncbi:MAG: DUF2249 domain-containing protein [Actinomycetota bacterium]|nr:DUF2249 domain-containing protein [Actinomycetota bacterium]